MENLINKNKYHLKGIMADECLLICRLSNYEIYFTTAVCINDRVYYDMFCLKQGNVNFPAPEHIMNLDEHKQKHLAVILRAIKDGNEYIPCYTFADKLHGLSLIVDDSEQYTIV